MFSPEAQFKVSIHNNEADTNSKWFIDDVSIFEEGEGALE